MRAIDRLTWQRQAELRGRLLFGEPMTDPTEARIAVAEIDRTLRRTTWSYPLGFGILLAYWAAFNRVPWALLMVLLVTGPLMVLQLRRTRRRNLAVLDAHGQPSADVNG